MATLRGAPDQLSFRSTARFAVLLAVLFVAHALLEPRLAIGAVKPDFYLIALVFSALRWGPLAGTLLGFVLGLNVDSFLGHHFGMHALALTVTGFLVGKMKESLYLDLPALDLILLFGAALLAGLLVTLVGHHESFAAFEESFFYEIPLGALYTAVLGGVLFRLVKD
ncbi:MAG: rod shape-determining protein MreD [Gemmatimonadota bacterium]